MNNIKKFLIIQCANVGDAVCGTPAIKLLRDTCPFAQIDVLVTCDASAQVIKNNPDINHIIYSESVRKPKVFAENYTDIIVFMATQKESEIAEKMGRAYWRGSEPNPVHLRDVGINLIHSLFPENKLPASDHNFLYPQPEDFISIEEKLKKAGATFDKNEILIACHVGCSKASKRALKFWKRNIASFRTWPFENFYELTKVFKKENPAIKWVMTGTLGEQKIIKKYFKTRENLIDLTAQTSVLELAALMKFCRVFFSGDSGPLHVASTTSVPMVSLFSSTHPSVTGPRPMRDNIILLIGQHSIFDISVEEVKKAIMKNLSNGKTHEKL